MAKATPDDEVGLWSEIKLEIVRKYAAAYTTVLNKQGGIVRWGYIDGFAGSGNLVSKETGQSIKGSAAQALEIVPPFHDFHFVDLDGSRADALRQLANDRNDVHVHRGDCNTILLRDVFPLFQWNDRRRALCILDPYKLCIDWNVLVAAGQARSIEVFYNFMVMDANMNVWKHDRSSVRPDQEARMTAVWGDDSWKELVWRKQKGLFEEMEEKEAPRVLIDAFRERLKGVAGFAYVPPPIPMRNSKNAIVYWLFFASPNSTGGKIVGEIFKRYT
jgi:three-Cys-motif partner protein